MRLLAEKTKSALASALRFVRGRGRGPEDPYPAVRVPVRRGPPDRRASVALAEPDSQCLIA